MQNFADTLIEAIKQKGNPCIIGLDPRMDLVPQAFYLEVDDKTRNEVIEDVLFDWGSSIIDSICDLVPAVKLQCAFYEAYGVPGVWAFSRLVRYAKEAGLIVIADGKRNDIGSTAEAYANAFLGRASVLGEESRVFDADALTVSPYMGHDSLLPFVEVCKKYGKGLFILVKTSNEGSGDFQNIKTEDGDLMYEKVAKMVTELGSDLIGKSGYSSIGAVVGATYPNEAESLRKIMPNNFFLVPGYGAQGGKAIDTKVSFNPDNLGALIHSARGITFSSNDPHISREEYLSIVRENVEKMIADVKAIF